LQLYYGDIYFEWDNSIRFLGGRQSLSRSLEIYGNGNSRIRVEGYFDEDLNFEDVWVDPEHLWSAGYFNGGPQ
jgi:hypothetical protein